MKQVILEKSFIKNYRLRVKPNLSLRGQYERRYALFVAGKKGPPLNDHQLTGGKRGFRSFSVTGNIRVIYVETDEAIIFIDVGTHNQVY
jgi:addiction module RelE/StbE family toxin